MRFTAGYNFFAFSRLIIDTIVNGTSSKNDAMNVLVLPAAMFNKVEFQFDIVRVPDGRSENRFGFAIGFGF